MLESDNIKKYLIKLIVFICLLVGMFIWSYLPMELFHFNLDNASKMLKILYSLACDIGFMIVLYFGYKKTINKNFKDYFKDANS